MDRYPPTAFTNECLRGGPVQDNMQDIPISPRAYTHPGYHKQVESCCLFLGWVCKIKVGVHELVDQIYGRLGRLPCDPKVSPGLQAAMSCARRPADSRGYKVVVY